MKLIWGLTVVSLFSSAAISWADDHPEAASPDDDTARHHQEAQQDGISFSPEWSTRYGGLCVQGRF